jgi:uncharacterized protein (DUF1778 family)
MRIRTDGDKAYREDIIDGLAADLDENRTDALLDAAMHTRQDIDAKQDLADWIGEEIEAGRLSVAQAEEVIEILSHPDVVAEPTVEVSIETAVGFDVTVDSAEPRS